MNEKPKRKAWMWLLLVLAGVCMFFVGIWIGLKWKTWVMYPLAAGGWVVAVAGGIMHFIKSHEEKTSDSQNAQKKD